MVLPLIIIGAVVIGGGIILIKNSDTIKNISYSIFTQEEKKKLDIQQQKKEINLSNRGFLGWAYAGIFGESAYYQIFQNRAKPQAPLLKHTGAENLNG